MNKKLSKLCSFLCMVCLLGCIGVSAQTDATKPTLTVVNAYRDTAILIVFSEPVDVGTSTTIANYGINNNVQINEVIWISGRSVILSTSKLTSGKTYTLTVSNIADLADPANVIVPKSPKQFVFVHAQSELPSVYPPGPVEVFSQVISVDMSHTSAAAEIRYTLDGSDPSSSSAKYSGNPITITSSLTLKARAFEVGLDSSMEVAIRFVRDVKGEITYPKGGETFSIGQTITLTWKSFDNAKFNLAYFWLSIDGGKNFFNITSTKHFLDSSSIAWTIPSDIEARSLANTNAVLMVKQYSGPDIAFSPVFRIATANSVRKGLVHRTGGLFIRSLQGIPNASAFEVSYPGSFRVRLINANGCSLAKADGMGAVQLRIPGSLPQGTYLLRIETRNRFLTQRVTICH